MTKNEKLNLMKDRLNKLNNLKAEKNIKCPGVRKKLERQIRNAETEV